MLAFVWSKSVLKVPKCFALSTTYRIAKSAAECADVSVCMVSNFREFYAHSCMPVDQVHISLVYTFSYLGVNVRYLFWNQKSWWNLFIPTITHSFYRLVMKFDGKVSVCWCGEGKSQLWDNVNGSTKQPNKELAQMYFYTHIHTKTFSKCTQIDGIYFVYLEIYTDVSTNFGGTQLTVNTTK